MSEIKDALNRLESEWKSGREVYDKYHKETKDGLENLSAETKSQIENFDAQLDTLEKKFADLETRAAMVNGDIIAEDAEMKGSELVNSFLRKGVHGAQFDTEDIKSLAPDSGPDGGYAIRPQFRQNIISKIQEISPVRQVAEVVTIGEGNQYVMLRENAEPTFNSVGPRTSISETSTGDYGQVNVYVHEQAAFPLIARQQVEDQFYNLETNLQNRLAREFAQDEGAQFINGTGVNEAYGILNNSSISIVDSGSATAFDFDDLTDLQSELKTGYNGAWGFNRKTRGFIRKLKGADNYFWEADMAAGAPNTLLGDPYFIMPDLAAPVSNAFSDGDKPIIYGDWFEGYVIVDKLGLTVEIDRLTNKPFIGYYTRKRVGGDVKQAEAFKVLRTTT